MQALEVYVNKIKGLNVEAIKKGSSNFLKAAFLPLLGIFFFLLLWAAAAKTIVTSLGEFPGPKVVAEQFIALSQEHAVERDKEGAFYQRQEQRNAIKLQSNPDAETKIRKYTGKETFFDQIITSLITVICGFVLALIIAIPLGIGIGLNKKLQQAINPIIQILKPVSPLAWLPLVTMVVSAVYTSNDPWLEKSFINSMITVTLCCLWPMLMNTSVGVSSVPQDLVNVSRVLNLPTLTHVKKIVIPSSIPMMFAGMRLSLGIAWMVLIAAEMLAQSPGLGKFVWDEFQNGSSNSLARIMVAVVVIGIIGFMLDRVMLFLQRVMSWQKDAVVN